MKRVAGVLVGLVLLAGCGEAKPGSLSDLTELGSCGNGWNVLADGKVAGCSNPKIAVGYDPGEYDNQYLIAQAQDDPAWDGCWAITDSIDWIVESCDKDFAAAVANTYGGILHAL